MIKHISKHTEVVFSFFCIHLLVHGFDYLQEGNNHGHVHTYLFLFINGELSPVSNKSASTICVFESVLPVQAKIN